MRMTDSMIGTNTGKPLMLRRMERRDEPLLQALYESSFPPAERRPWNDVVALHDGDGRFEVHVLDVGGDVAGMLTEWRFDTLRYVEHFAVFPSMRGGGVGARSIGMLLGADTRPVVLEVELPEGGADDMTRRRVRFYERCGFVSFPAFSYIQPPYSPGLPSLELMLMASSEAVDLEDATRLLHTHVYGVDCR